MDKNLELRVAYFVYSKSWQTNYPANIRGTLYINLIVKIYSSSDHHRSHFQEVVKTLNGCYKLDTRLTRLFPMPSLIINYTVYSQIELATAYTM